jgi:hypothetical protein
MTDDDVRQELPKKGSGRTRVPDPYAVQFAEDRRADPGTWRRFRPNGENFHAQHLAVNAREEILRGTIPPWDVGRWGASTRKIRGKWDVRRRRFMPEWELWVAFEPRKSTGEEPPADEPGASQAEQQDAGQPAFRFFDRY